MANSVETTYTAKMGLTSISTANSNLNGTGTLRTIISGGSGGTLIKTLIIKAQTDTSQGMVRLYVKKSGGDNTLLSEVYIPPVNKSGNDLSYYNVIPLDYTLESGEQLNVSTQVGNTFNIIAEAFDISYSATAGYIGSSLEYIPAAGAGVVNTANPNLDGSGSIVKIMSADATAKGCDVASIVIKAQETTVPGMVRLYIQDNAGGNKFLFCEVLVPPVVQSGTTPAFEFEVIGSSGLCLAPGYSIWASTEESNIFGIVCGGYDWKYV